MAPGAGLEPARLLVNSQMPFQLGYPGMKLVAEQRIEHRISCAQDKRLPTRLLRDWSGRLDSNQRVPASDAS